VDVDKKTWLMPRLTEWGCSDCALPVDLYGAYNYPPMWARRCVVDATENFGVNHNLADYTVYSFNGNKTITTGGGGLIVGSELDWIRKASRQGGIGEWHHDCVGYNYAMPALNAALGLAQIKRVDEFIKRKRDINTLYRQELPFLTFQESPPGTYPTWWFTACLLPDDVKVEKVQYELNRLGIPTRRVFRPLNHSRPYYDGREYPVAEMLWQRGLCLPSSVKNTDDDICYVIESLKTVLCRGGLKISCEEKQFS